METGNWQIRFRFVKKARLSDERPKRTVLEASPALVGKRIIEYEFKIMMFRTGALDSKNLPVTNLAWSTINKTFQYSYHQYEMFKKLLIVVK